MFNPDKGGPKRSNKEVNVPRLKESVKPLGFGEGWGKLGDGGVVKFPTCLISIM